ncbi:hypothetical protein BGZ46_000826 [Entomortierella lignicola]|nr:hypothetical protein BGZ46_000826 [Entomortierella lignicola]
MERMKRARHRSSTAVDEVITEDQQEYSKIDEKMIWNESAEQRSEALPFKSLNHIDNRQTGTQQQATRIHPFDNEPTPMEVQTPTEDRATSGRMPIIPKAPEHISHSKSSVHPLDTDESHEVTMLDSQEVMVNTGDSMSDQHLKADQKLESVSVNLPAENSSVDIEKTTDRAQNLNRPKVQDSSVGTKDISATSADRTVSSAQSSKPSSVSGPTCNPATLMLPITRETLRELDMLEIFKNPQLRHDIVFDPHLQFRPNFDGERGHTKRREADRFWREVGLELNNRRTILATRREATATMLDLTGITASNPTSRLVQLEAQQTYPLPDAVLLPRLIDELREILLSLLPQPPVAQDAAPVVNPERALLISTLDPDLLIQELDHGVLDVHALFRFLGDSLKGHCAPMRDALVESMVNIVVDFDEIVRGIRMCFEILEWMKLDIANHQLRTLRPWLLDNSIDFESKYFTQHLARSGTIHRTKEWFKQSWIKWEAIKHSVIGPQQSSIGESSTLPDSSSSPTSDGELSGSESKLSPSTSSSSSRRRSSIIRADIGENILDGVVNEGLLEMIMKPHSSVNTMPETFEFDHYRMLSFHNDFQDLTILCTLLILFRQLAQNCWTQQDLVEIKKVVWLLLTDENANFGANANPGSGATAGAGEANKAESSAQSHVSSSSGMKDIVIQIEFAARKVRERSKNAASAARHGSITPKPSASVTARHTSQVSAPIPGDSGDSIEKSLAPTEASSSLMAVPPASMSTSSAPSSSLSASDTNLLTAWLDNALCKTSTLYMLIQKRLLIHFRRWLYVHSSSSMLVLSATCSSLASAMSMSSAKPEGQAKTLDEDDDDDKPISATAVVDDGDSKKVQDCEGSNGKNGSSSTASTPTNVANPSAGQAASQGVSASPVPPKPELSPEEANKAAAEALAAKLSFNATEMEAHGLTGLEDEMIALLEKIRAVSEFNKKVYGTWYRDMVKEGRAENWLEKSSVVE